MPMNTQGWMHPNEGEAIAAIHEIDPESNLLMECLFNESRQAVWEAAVVHYNPERRRKQYTKYIKFLTNQQKIATIAVKCPDIQMCQFAATKLEDQTILKEMYASDENQQYDNRILQLLEDFDFIAEELRKKNPAELEAFFDEISESDIALRFYRRLPEGCDDLHALALQRHIALASIEQLLDALRKNEAKAFQDAALERLIHLTDLEKIKLSPEDAQAIAKIAQKGEEDNLAIVFLNKSHWCWKCPAKMVKTGSTWDKSVHHAYSADTGQKYTHLECPTCGYEYMEKAYRWQ